MKQIASMALILTLSVATVHANEEHVKMTFSGTSENSATNLQQPDTSNDLDVFTGDGTLGAFTVRNIRAMDSSPSSSSTCSGSNYLYFTEPAGGSVFRFHDGSLLYLSVTKGSDCIDLAANDAHCTLTLQITGGTGRFKNASGILTMAETVVPVLAGPLNNAPFYAATGEFTGTVYGISEEEERPSEGQ
jgi:hypothetical protein